MTKTQTYNSLLRQLDGLLAPQTDPIANMANLSAVLFNGLENLNWAGFYVLREGTLVLGPFQGKPACVRIALGKGVCGTAAQTRQTLLIRNVHEFPGHIACDSASKSEIVIPIFKNDTVWGVLDIDSPVLARFDKTDQLHLEKVTKLFEKYSHL